MVERARRAAFIYSTQLERYAYPPGFPLVVQRAKKAYDLLKSMGLLDAGSVVAPRSASREELENFHSRRYLAALQRAAKGEMTADASRMGLGTPDCPIFGDMYDVSVWACGATLTGAALILSGAAEIVFNPFGGFHHAKAEKAAGFCYLNDMVLGCMALSRGGKRVLYLDLDAHHGDGVQEAFYEKKEILAISLHESGETLFPGTGAVDEIGAGDGLGFNVNIPLPLGTYDEAYLAVFDRIVSPLIQWYAPDAIVLELGMDALAGDPLAHLCLTNNAYADVISRLLRFKRPILAAGGGGYDIEKTVRGWALAWRIFACESCDRADASLGMGGVMLQSGEWSGGLRDRKLSIPERQRISVGTALEATMAAVIANVFGRHGIDSPVDGSESAAASDSDP